MHNRRQEEDNAPCLRRVGLVSKTDNAEHGQPSGATARGVWQKASRSRRSAAYAYRCRVSIHHISTLPTEESGRVEGSSKPLSPSSGGFQLSFHVT